MASTEPSRYHSKLKDTRVLIIGGTSGVGFGLAEALLEHGAFVVVSSSTEGRVVKAVQRLQAVIPSARSRIRGFTCDLSSQEGLEAEVDRLFMNASTDGKLDHVVHTAGDALVIGKLEDFSLKDIVQAGMVRFFSSLIVAQRLRKYMHPGPATSYTMTTGGASERPQKDWTLIIPYLTGLQGMCLSLARDLAPIRVNLVGLGPVETELWNPFKESGQFGSIKADFEAKMATGALGRVEDVVESYLYLMKDKNATGSMVYSNGGMLLM